MGQEYVMNTISDIEILAKSKGLDFFPIIFEMVNKNIMLESCSYGLISRARHWSYGKSYDQQKLWGTMGWSKVYEIIFQNNPAYAFLLNTNSDIINIMVAAHCFGHSHFFKNNIMFKNSDRSMVYRAAERATRVDDYIEKYGLEKVEHLMDIAFAIEKHIDWHKGLFRKKYPGKQIKDCIRKCGEFDDILGKDKGRRIKRKVIEDKLPSAPEKDILWFLANYAPLEDWERDIFSIIREESYYFFPIVTTKIMNEGWACVDKDSLIYTNDGLIFMENLVKNKEKIIFDGENRRTVYDSNILKNKDVFKVLTKRGLEIKGSNNHRILLSSREWKQLDKINIGESIKISGGNNLWPTAYQNIDFKIERKKTISSLCRKYGISYDTYHRFTNNTHNTRLENVDIIKNINYELETERINEHISAFSYKNRKEVRLPNIIDENLASFLGYLIGDGHISKKGRNLGLTSGDKASIDNFEKLVSSIFKTEIRKKFDNSSKNGRWRALVYSTQVSDFCTKGIGMKYGICARTKSIPNLILQSPQSVMSSFLRSYFDCDGCASEKYGIILSTSSDKLAEQTQLVLMNYGILSHRKKAKDDCWQLRITGKSAQIFCKEIGFGLERKQKNLEAYLMNHRFFKEERWKDEIVSIEYCGKQDVYDISVSDTHRYVANGFINHNSFWHAELMHEYDKLSEQEYFDFAKCHSGVVNPGNMFNINPYYLGFKIFTDIRERWDKLYKEGKSAINGIQKIIKVAAEEDDASFLRNYLTKELAKDLGLFNYGYRKKRDPNNKKPLSEEDGIIELKDRDLDKIIENIIRPTINYGAPLITVDQADGDTLIMRHRDTFGPLDEKYMEKTLEFIFEIWGGCVELNTVVDGKNRVYTFDESGLEVL